MSDPSPTIAQETPNDAKAIERLHERTFGPGRFVLTAARLREQVGHRLDLSFTARIGTLLVGSVRQLPVCIGDTPALMLGPLTVEPPFRSHGIGRALMERALAEARAKGVLRSVSVGGHVICDANKVATGGTASLRRKVGRGLRSAPRQIRR